MMQTARAVPGYESTVPAVEPEQYADDKTLVAKIMRKRQEEMARRTRLMDPRGRVCGVNTQDLDFQTAEKKMKAEEERQMELEYLRQRQLQEGVMCGIEEMKKNLARDRQISNLEYSRTNLSKEQRREFALSDPSALKREVPPGEDGQPVGPGTLHPSVFEGDVDVKALTKHQRNIQREWLLEQMQEKQAKQEAERMATMQDHQEATNANVLRANIEHAELEEARQERLEMVKENEEMAAVVRARRNMRAQKEAEIEKNQVNGVRTSNMMNEVHDYELNAAGRLEKTGYKRLTVEEEQEVYQTQAYQMQEKELRKQREREEEDAYNERFSTQVKVMNTVEGAVKTYWKTKQAQMVDHNKAMAAAKAQKDLEDKREYLAFDPIE